MEQLVFICFVQLMTGIVLYQMVASQFMVEDKERFYCPCHASSFDKHGDFIDQPVPRALDVFTIAIEDDQLQIDTSHPIQRECFSMDELVYG